MPKALYLNSIRGVVPPLLVDGSAATRRAAVCKCSPMPGTCRKTVIETVGQNDSKVAPKVVH